MVFSLAIISSFPIISLSMSESNLRTLIQQMQPQENPGEYVFCVVSDITIVSIESIICFFREDEGITIIIEKAIAEKHDLPYSGIFGWITLQIESSLEAVGLTATFATALGQVGISCNVVAGYHHDHIFVQKHLLTLAIETLENLSNNTQ